MDDPIDDLIDDITVDAYGPDEQLWAFRQVFEDNARFPFAGHVVGAEVQVDMVDYDGDDLRGLVAVCERDGRRHTVSLLDVTLPGSIDPDTARLIQAYRRWAGADPRPRRSARRTR
ncbi:MAG: calcium-binding protein [Actinomycetota bacterium]